MRTFLFVIVYSFVFIPTAFAQKDSLVQQGKDSLFQKRKAQDSSIVKPARKRIHTNALLTDSVPAVLEDSLPVLPPDELHSFIQFQEMMRHHPYFDFQGKPVTIYMEEKNSSNRDWLFYLMVGLLFYFAFIKYFFGKYLANMVTLFFRATMRQQQIREQLLQSPLPSLLLNILFVVVGGLYLTFLANYYQFAPVNNFWLFWLYCTGFLTILYLGKYFILKFTGWVFKVSTGSDTYIFIIFLVNKMVGILLLPFLILMAFPYQNFLDTSIVLSFILLVAMFLYRFFISYRPVKNEININRFHFFIYLCAFEIAPLLLIYKVLLNLVGRSY